MNCLRCGLFGADKKADPPWCNYCLDADWEEDDIDDYGTDPDEELLCPLCGCVHHEDDECYEPDDIE